MKKLLFVLLIILVSISSCSESPGTIVNSTLSTEEYLTKNPSVLKTIVDAENRKAPLSVQSFNKIKNNIVKIHFEDLILTTCTVTHCKGYFVTKWTIKTEYFGEEEYEYLIECHKIHADNDYISWKIIWPDYHPFIDK